MLSGFCAPTENVFVGLVNDLKGLVVISGVNIWPIFGSVSRRRARRPKDRRRRTVEETPRLEGDRPHLSLASSALIHAERSSSR